MKLLFALTILFPVVSFGAPDLASLPDVVILAEKTELTYDVVCRNGNREVDTVFDLLNNNVCPNPRGSTPTNIEYISSRGDGLFDILCKDSTRLQATQEQVLSNEVCKLPTWPVLQEGIYKAENEYAGFFNQNIKITKEGVELKSVHITVAESEANINLLCEKGLCEGEWSFGVKAQLEPLSKDEYKFKIFSGADSIGKAIVFKKF